MTITAAQDNYDRFLYADTDSLHLLGTDPPHGVDVDPHALGKWKHEYDFDEGLFLRAKQYGERVGDEYVVHIAGAPRSITDRMTLADMVDGAVFMVNWSLFAPVVEWSSLTPRLHSSTRRQHHGTHSRC